MGKLGKRLMRMGLWYSPFRKTNGADGNLASCMGDISDPFAVVIHRQQLLAAAWSFGIAATNTWPHVMHDGTPLTKVDGYRWQMRCHQLNDAGVVPIVIGFTGDLQWDLKSLLRRSIGSQGLTSATFAMQSTRLGRSPRLIRLRMRIGAPLRGPTMMAIGQGIQIR